MPKGVKFSQFCSNLAIKSPIWQHWFQIAYKDWRYVRTLLQQNALTGWNFAQLTDVVVHRVRNGEPMTDERNTARLVYSDGCRNPAYRVLAPFNPWRDGSNGLINNFDFRVFMFQSMESGDAIMITAKVMACVEETDCAPVRTRGTCFAREQRTRHSFLHGAGWVD